MWVPPDTRDSIVDFVCYWSRQSELNSTLLIDCLDIGRSKFYDWRKRYGRSNNHNGNIPRCFWLLDWEKQAIIDYYTDHPLDGYRRLAFMMIDEGIVAVSPSSVYRVLSGAGLLKSWNTKRSKKGTGFVQPLKKHEHWHVDVSYINICGTFYYLCSLLDGYSRYIVHWEIRESMTEADIEIVIKRAQENHPTAKPRIISDNGPQFISGDFKKFIKISGMTHVRTSPYYPQSNGKLERFHKTIKKECIRPGSPLSLEDAQRIVMDFVEYYNTVRLHSAIGYVAPADKLNGRDIEILAERDRRLEKARKDRKQRTIDAGKIAI